MGVNKKLLTSPGMVLQVVGGLHYMCFFVGVHKKSGCVFWQLVWGVAIVCGVLEWKRICCCFNLFVFQAYFYWMILAT